MKIAGLIVRTAIAACILTQGAGVVIAQSSEDDSPAFTTAQSVEGRKAYRTHCSVCHGDALEGVDLAPGLVGVSFDQNWRGKSAGVLSFHMNRMPPASVGEPGSLGDETYTNILAYILRMNGFDSGDVALPSDSTALNEVRIPKLPDSDFDPLIPVEGGANSPLLKNLKPVTNEMLMNPSPNDWMHWGGTYDGQSYSSLDEINKSTVNNLKLAWRLPLYPGRNMPMPIVYQGVMFYTTNPDTVLAMDAATGDVLWRYQHNKDARGISKMGVSLHGNKLFVATSDHHVVALNVKTGELIWKHAITSPLPGGVRRGSHLRSAPLIVGDKVIQGVCASMNPGGAFILALDIETGKEVWRFNTVAGPGEPYGDTWNDLPLAGRSGGSVWHQGTYDPEFNLVYFGVAPTYDTKPLLYPSDKPGVKNNAMFTNCTVALDADTGELVWTYQHMQNDQWDLDWAFERQIAEFMVDGKKRKVVMNVGKMAMLDALDAATGEFLFSVDPGVQNVISAVDPITGAKTIAPGKMPNAEKGSLICPNAAGSRSWPQTSYSPRTKMAYLPLTENCTNISTTSDRRGLLSTGISMRGGTHPDTADGMVGRIQAIDLENQELGWNTDLVTPPTTGLLSTAGGLVFSGDIDPSLKAFDDTTGEILWEADLDDSPSSSLITYIVGDIQYIAVVVGLSNNHVRDMTNVYRAYLRKEGQPPYNSPKGGAAIWVFSLD